MRPVALDFNDTMRALGPAPTGARVHVSRNAADGSTTVHVSVEYHSQVQIADELIEQSRTADILFRSVEQVARDLSAYVAKSLPLSAIDAREEVRALKHTICELVDAIESGRRAEDVAQRARLVLL